MSPVSENLLSEIKLHSPDGHGHNTAIEINGHPVKTAHGVRFEAKADAFATVHLDLVAQCFDYTGKAHIILGDETMEALISLGWTPPA